MSKSTTSTKTATKTRARKVKVAPLPTRTRNIPTTAKITVLVDGNPKRGHAARRYGYYKSGLTVGGYISALKKNGTGNTASAEAQAYRDINWDVKMGWIKVS